MKNRSIGKNVIFNLLKTMSSIIFPLITIPYITRVLQVDNIGKINFGNSIVGYISLIASLGVSTYAIRECSRVRDDKKELDNMASQMLSINFISTLISYLILIVLLLFCKSLSSYEVLILIQSSSIIFATFGADWINSAMEDFRYIAIRTFFIQLVSLLCMLLFVNKPEDYLIYAVISVVAQSGANMINIIYRRRYCKIRITLHIDWKRHMKPIILLFAMVLAQTIFVNVDITMLGVMKGDREVGLYGTAVKIYLMVNQIIASIAWVVMPRLSNLFHTKNYKEINRVLRYTANIICVLGVPSVVGLNVLAPEILNVIAGKEYMSAAVPLRILTLALIFSLLGGFIGNIILIPAGKENICLISCIVSAAINFILNIILIPIFGMDAAAITTAISQIVAFLISSFFIDKNISLIFIRKIIAGPVVGGFVIFAIGICMKSAISNVYMCVAVTILCSVLAYIATLLIFKNELVLIWKEKIRNFVNI